MSDRNAARIMTFLATLMCVAAAQAAPAAADLAVRRVAVFNSGVAYYECAATVDGDAVATLNFRTEQINDILKSLLVQDLGGGTIGVVRYASQDPIDKTLKSFGVDITGQPTLGDLLDQLRGQPVQIEGDRSLRGLIVGVEKQTEKVGDSLVEHELLTILADTGLQRVALDSLHGIKLLDEKVAGELRKALGVLATSSDASKKSIELHFRGQGRRQVRVAYLLEAPIWKTSYRLALDEENAKLQGWATVENATEEDWDSVELSLVSGRPISFRMDLYTPIYIPRPVEELELYASLRPPEFEGAMAEMKTQASLGYARDAAAPQAPPPGRSAAKMRVRMGRNAFGGGRNEEAVIGQGVASVADAGDAGELFAYTINTPVSIRRQQSAMLPIVNQSIEAHKVSIYNPATHAKYPLNGLELRNSTDLHLMQGPVTVFDGGTYAGDAKLPDLNPGEKRLIAYALDLSTEVDMKNTRNAEQVTSMRIVKGALIRTHKYVDVREYVVKNKGDHARTLLIEQPYGDDWKLITPEKPYERTASLSRFKLDVPAGKTGSLRVRLERIADQTIALSNLAADQMRLYVRSRVISGELRKALEKAIGMQAALEQTRRDREAAEHAAAEAVKDQARVRENLKALSANSDAHRRQLKKFDELETQIEQIRARVEALRQTERQQRAALEDYLSSLTVE